MSARKFSIVAPRSRRITRAGRDHDCFGPAILNLGEGCRVRKNFNARAERCELLQDRALDAAIENDDASTIAVLRRVVVFRRDRSNQPDRRMPPCILGKQFLGMQECGIPDRECRRDRSVLAQGDDERARVDVKERGNALLFQPRA